MVKTDLMGQWDQLDRRETVVPRAMSEPQGLLARPVLVAVVVMELREKKENQVTLVQQGLWDHKDQLDPEVYLDLRVILE